jgi:hypothetical protein
VRIRSLALLAVLLGAGDARVQAQSMRDQCGPGLSPSSEMLCHSLADAAVTLPDRIAIAAAGGNPVAGTASTLGMRVPGSPRWSVALRSTIARATLPPIGDDEAFTPTLWSMNVDGAIGLFNGVNLMPTIGGFASIDILASLGVLSVPEDDGFERSTPLTWAIGTRVGILRESFTAPGVSVSAMYRSLPDVSQGPFAEASFRVADQSVVSLRGTVGKRVLGIGFTGGMGYDRTRSDVQAAFSDPDVVLGLPPRILSEEVTSGRTSFFGNISYTLLSLNMAAELGWQADGDRPAGAHGDTGKGGLFGGISARLAI